MKRLFPTLLLFASIANANPLAQNFNFDGTLLDNSGNPVISPSVQLLLQVVDQTQTCILYSETQTVNTETTQGAFSVQVGSPTLNAKRSPADPGNSWASVFQNDTSMTGSLVSTGASCTYAPSPYDGRYLRVTVTDSVTNVADVLSPNLPLAPVPMASVAESLVAGAAVNASTVSISSLFSLASPSSSSYVGLKAAPSMAASVNFTLPSADGTSGQILSTNGSGLLGWTTPSGGGSLPTSGGSLSGPLTISPTSGSGLTVEPSTAANGISNVSSPTISITSNYWTGTSSGADTFNVSNVTGTGANPFSTLTFSHSGSTSGGGYSFLGGNVGIGTTSPAVSLDIGSRTDGLALPQGTTAQEPGSVPFGTTRYNTDQYSVETWTWPGQWESLSHKYYARWGFGTTAPNSLLEISAGGLNQNPSLIYGSTFAVDAVPFTDAQTLASGTAAGTAFITLSSSSVGAMYSNITTTNADTVLVTGAPAVGTNQTLTNSSALYIKSNNVGALTMNSFGLNVNAPTGATNNYAAVFNGGNVGIGTTTPYATLDINGTAKLKVNSAPPAACAATNAGTISLTHLYVMCVCNSTSWVQTSDGATACSW